MPLFIEHLCRIFNERFNRKIEGVSNEVLQIFMNYSWPGNVRELEHVIEHAFIICHGRVITIDDLPTEIRELGRPGKTSASVTRTAVALESQEILNALTKARWNKTKAAHLLGINRRTLYRKLELLHIDPSV